MNKTSVIITVKNEDSSIELFLNSLFKQTRQPDEVVVVDGGSTDGTIQIINEFQSQGHPIKLIVEPGANIAKGRNIAIVNASFDIIASTDAGCRLDSKWLEKITEPFVNPEVNAVAGITVPEPKTLLERCQAILTYPKPEDIDPEVFLPSSRSVAFRKEAWRNIGGYPEWLYTAEDTLFDVNLKKAGYSFLFVPAAIVYWRPRPTIAKFFKQVYMYNKGDIEAGLYSQDSKTQVLRYVQKTVIFLGTLVLGIFWPILLLVPAYLLYRHYKINIHKILRDSNDWRSVFYMPIVQQTLELASISGYIAGQLTRFRQNRKSATRNKS